MGHIFEAPPPSNSPLPVGRPTNPAPDPLDVNHFLARGARPKEPVRKQKPLDTQAMNSTAGSILRPNTSPPKRCLLAKKPRLADLLQLLLRHPLLQFPPL